MKITIATCQFPVTSNIRRNLGYVKRQMRSAREQGADLAHFSECCLGGYAGVDLPSLEGYDWDLLQRSVQRGDRVGPGTGSLADSGVQP